MACVTVIWNESSGEKTHAYYTVERLVAYLLKIASVSVCSINFKKMSRKVPKDNLNYRPARPRRRKYEGNQFSCVEDINTVEESNDEEASASAKKLKKSLDDIIINPSFCYRIIEFISVFSALADILVCSKCKQKVSFGESGEKGLGFKLSVTCKCGTVLIPSSPFILNAYEINRRIVFAMRLLGVAREGIHIFCGIMNLGTGISQHAYDRIIQHIHVSVKKLFEVSTKNAIELEKKENEKKEKPILNLTVSGDLCRHRVVLEKAWLLIIVRRNDAYCLLFRQSY